jgi:hypothetical protein
VIALVGSLPGLLVALGRIALGHLRQPTQEEVELDRHRLLTPPGAVVVEDGDPLLDPDPPGQTSVQVWST